MGVPRFLVEFEGPRISQVGHRKAEARVEELAVHAPTAAAALAHALAVTQGRAKAIRVIDRDTGKITKVPIKVKG